LIDKIDGELGRSTVIKIVDNPDPLLVESSLLRLNLLKDFDSARCVNEEKTIHLIKELLDGVLLFQLVEADNCLFPCFVVMFKLFLI
jgi:hypothetical protein